MMNSSTRKSILFDSPAAYQIRVEGCVDPAWFGRLEGMLICQTTKEPGYTITTLQGELNDLAALAGVLNSLMNCICQSFW